MTWLLLALLSLTDTRYYLVEGAMELPTGRAVGGSVSVVKRVVDSESGKVEETVLNLRGREAATETVTTISKDGKMSTADGSFTGQATFSGSGQKMSFTATLPANKMRVEGEDSFGPEAISAVKKIYGSDGGLQIVIRESGKSISERTYLLLRERLMK